MTRFHADLAGRTVPRYTSYPTAAEFSPVVGAERQGLALIGVEPATPVSLYVHIPYCREICWYCGCNTGAAGKGGRLASYVDALTDEIMTVGALMRGRVTSVHFGGGSPNALAPADLVAIGAAIRDGFDLAPDAQWAMEIDPRGFGAAHAGALAAIGVARASLGAQTFAPHVQRAINRVQPFSEVAAAVGHLRRAGIDAINLDLMYGLPGQRERDIAETIADALILEPARIAMFGYAHLPRMLPRQRMIDAAALPDAAARFAQSERAHRELLAAGYRPVGFDHYALPGDPLALAARDGLLRRNFQGFTDDRATTLVGLGASAISQFDGVIVQNEKHVGRYRQRVLGGGLAAERGVRRDTDDRLRGAIIEALLCRDTVDLAALVAEAGGDVCRFAETLPALDGFAARGLLVRQGWRIAFTPAARPWRRLVAALFDRYRAAAPQRFSAAV